MKLYVGNPTRLKQRVYYRLDVSSEGVLLDRNRSLPNFQDIEPGRQVAIGGELLHASQADEIIKQLRPYGMYCADEANRLTGFVAYVYSIDRPVPAKVLEKVFNHNMGVKTEEGAKRREEAAIAAGTLIQAETPTVGFEQLDGEDRIEQGFRVDKTATPEAIAQANSKGRRRSRGNRLNA